MALCRHARRGIVTNQITDRIDFNLPHAAADSCDRRACIIAVGRWVSGKTGMPAFWRNDKDKTQWVPVDLVVDR